MSNITLTELRGEYQRLWDSCQILPEWEDRVNEVVGKIKANRARYEAIASTLGKCPWYFIGAIHNMEASLDFSKHLHNGDSLRRRTVQVPAGRPVEPPNKGWDEGYTWEESAADALKLQEIDRVRDWSISGLLFQSERYNGWGYRQYHPEVLSPYLWSGTNHYTQGKYASDGHFDRNLQSEQVGVVPLFKQLMEDIDTPVLQIAKPQDNKPLLKGGACKLRTEQDTWFTQAPLSIDQLDENDGVFIRARTILPVLAWREIQNNYLVVTFGTVFEGRNTWHVKADHVRMSVPTFVKPSTQKQAPVQHATSRPIVAGDLSTLPGDKVLRFMKSRDFRIRAINIVYLVNTSADNWSPLAHTIDAWNDVRCVIRDTGEVLGSWKATTDPGRHYLYNPMNPAGCAILALGQHKDGWAIGLHHNYPALSQCGNLVIYRDRTKSGNRTGHTVIAGPECGINHHGTSGKDGDPNSIGRWSAGCCVGLYWKSHLQFMQFCRDSGNSTFDATLVDGVSLSEFN